MRSPYCADTIYCRPAAQPVSLPHKTQVGDILLRLFESLGRWQQRARSRRDLMAMDDHLLKDIGLSRADAWQEADKPFWRD